MDSPHLLRQKVHALTIRQASCFKFPQARIRSVSLGCAELPSTKSASPTITARKTCIMSQ